MLVCLLCFYHTFVPCSQYPTEDEDDYDGLDLLNFFIAMTLLSGDDDDDVDDYDFTFSDLTEEYGF